MLGRPGVTGAATVAVATATVTGGAVVLLGWNHGRYGLGAVAFLVVWLVFCLVPWAVLPVGIIGGTLVAVLLGETEVRGVVIIHAALLLAGFVALLTRRLLGADRPAATSVLRWGHQLGMLGLLVVAIVGATYGLAVGNAADQVLVATYLVAVIPIYFLITVHTLTTPQRRTAAGVLFLVGITVSAAAQFGSAGRHGGLLSLVAVPPLIVLAGRYRGWARAGLAALAAGLTADVVLASYRGIWVAGGLALVVLLVRGDAIVRRGLIATALAGGVLGVLVLAADVIGQRSLQVGEALDRSAGYRLPEAAIGWEVFAAQPVFGAGLGQRTPQIYIPGFALTEVGPVYHAFYVLLLANLGIVGLVLVLWPILRCVWTGLRERGSLPLAYAALTVGFLGAALVSSPTDGHWELGLLPALAVLTAAPATRRVREAVPTPAYGWRFA